MIIDESNVEIGINAMMHASYFYYQLLDEGEFSCGQTAYWRYDDFTCWEVLQVFVNEPKNVSLGIDECFLREAAMIYILCMLKNVYSELEESDWLDASEDIIQIFRDRGRKIIPEIDDLLKCVVALPQNINFTMYNKIMKDIFDRYVRGRFLKLINKN